MFNLNNFRAKDVKNDVLAGVVVSVALIPEATAFSLLAGLSPTIGLHTAFILGLVTAFFGGKPGMISGAAGSIIVV
ncbi:SulP family inorganic anion transporter, partial [Erwinia amylovora]